MLLQFAATKCCSFSEQVNVARNLAHRQMLSSREIRVIWQVLNWYLTPPAWTAQS